ncbi:MAG: cupin domain-containing protein [Bacteroidales bacterium]|nr:cupin domain-containing protein [Bacteroidales bacterium]
MLLNAEHFIKKLGLIKHPEGGYFREIYRSNELCDKLPLRFEGSRNFCTSIYFLLAGEDVSHFHKIKSDEIWHFYYGTALKIYVLNENKTLSTILLGNRLENDECFQYVVEKDRWFAAELKDKNSFALVGCTVSPGFDFSDFTLAKKKDLLADNYSCKELIEKLT